jgi:two-component system, cell cycle response regulator DivK
MRRIPFGCCALAAKRPRSPAAEQRDEVAPFHCPVPLLGTERIAHRGTAALRDFGPAYDGFGSNPVRWAFPLYVRSGAASGNPRGEAEDGEAGLAPAAAHRPDLILMDIQLPGLDGYEATRRLKADATLHAIPVIAITAYELNEAEDKARAAGCDAYMAKPISPRQLLAKVREYLSPAAPTR